MVLTLSSIHTIESASNEITPFKSHLYQVPTKKSLDRNRPTENLLKKEMAFFDKNVHNTKDVFKTCMGR